MIEEYFGDSMAFDLVFVDWIQWFNATDKKEDFDGHYCFKEMAKASFKYVEDTLVALNDAMGAAVPTTVSSA